MQISKRRALKKLVRSVLPANPSSKVVETFFGEAIAQDLPMANSVRELAEWIVDRLLEDPEQLRKTLNRLDDGSPKVAELLAWADMLPAEGISGEGNLEERPERPLTSRERFDRSLRIVETGATVIGGVGSPMAIYYGLNRRDDEPEAGVTETAAGADGGTLAEPEPELEISPRDPSPLRRSRSLTNDSESVAPSSPGPLVRLDFQTGEGKNLFAQELLVEQDQIELIENWLSKSDPRDLGRELIFEGYVATGGAPVPILAEIETTLEPVSIRYQGPSLTLKRELPVLVAARVEPKQQIEQPTGEGMQTAAFEVPAVSWVVGLPAVAFLGAWSFRKASRRMFKALFESD